MMPLWPAPAMDAPQSRVRSCQDARVLAVGDSLMPGQRAGAAVPRLIGPGGYRRDARRRGVPRRASQAARAVFQISLRPPTMHLGHRYGPRRYLPERCAARVPPHQPPWSPARPPLPSSGCRRPALGHRGEAEPLASGRSQLGSALCQRVGARSTAPRPPEAAAQRGCRPDPDNRLRDRDAGSYTAMDMFGPCRTAARPVAMIVCPGSMPPTPPTGGPAGHGPRAGVHAHACDSGISPGWSGSSRRGRCGGRALRLGHRCGVPPPRALLPAPFALGQSYGSEPDPRSRGATFGLP